jgi:hypothetical protein
MMITSYQYEPASGKGNMLLSLVTGGMRAITGLLGRNQPDRVAYRAATATIGIRGTDVTIVSNGTDVEVTVTDGSVTLTVGAEKLTLTAGQTAYVHNNAITSERPAGFNSTYQDAVRDLGRLTSTMTSAEFTVENASAGTGTVQGIYTPGGGAGGGSVVSPH